MWSFHNRSQDTIILEMDLVPITRPESQRGQLRGQCGYTFMLQGPGWYCAVVCGEWPSYLLAGRCTCQLSGHQAPGSQKLCRQEAATAPRCSALVIARL